MAKPPSLTESQKLRLSRLEPQLVVALRNKDIELVRRLVLDIQQILKPTGHIIKLALIQNSLFELAIDLKEYDFAEKGLTRNRSVLNNNTRVYLETTALLAICYLRKCDYDQAKIYIKEVLQNEKVIKSVRTRQKFRKEIIDRFDEESALFSLRDGIEAVTDIEEIQEEAIKLVTSNNIDEIYIVLGKSLPPKTKDILLLIDEFAKNQLPSAERLMLPSSKDVIKDENAGRTVFSSLKRVIYQSLCDPSSEIYKTLFTNGLGIVMDRKYIAGAVVSALAGLGIGLKALAITATALIIRFGIDVYCHRFKPMAIMEIRK